MCKRTEEGFIFLFEAEQSEFYPPPGRMEEPGGDEWWPWPPLAIFGHPKHLRKLYF